MEKKKRQLGYCPLQSTGTKDGGIVNKTCNIYCQWYCKGMGCCVVHGINDNLGRIAKFMEMSWEKLE